MDIYEYEDVISSRLSFDELYLEFSKMLSRRSTCVRASVGCVITSGDHSRVLAIGYNGNYKNGPNCCDTDKPGACGCLHAEENAIIKLDYNDHAKKFLYTTTSPCIMCAKRIINAGICRVVYDVAYRKNEGIELLMNNNVEVIKLK